MLLKPQAFSFMLSVVFGCTFLGAQNRVDAKSSHQLISSYQQAIERAAITTGVPSALLLCIARVESGRATPQGIQPWPWALNVAGTSRYFANKKEALVYVNKCLAQGMTNIDIGILQLNFKWHSQGFTNLEAMLDPHFNALYAARFLKRLRLQHGSWSKAVASYHSSQPHRGQAYITKVAAHLTFKLQPTLKATALKYAASRQTLLTQSKQRKPS
jgi:hypothetical protein